LAEGDAFGCATGLEAEIVDADKADFSPCDRVAGAELHDAVSGGVLDKDQEALLVEDDAAEGEQFFRFCRAGSSRSARDAVFGKDGAFVQDGEFGGKLESGRWQRHRRRSISCAGSFNNPAGRRERGRDRWIGAGICDGRRVGDHSGFFSSPCCHAI